MLPLGMRVVAFDPGTRRLGVAVSDRSQTLARPYAVVEVRDAADLVEKAVALVDRLAADEDGLAAIVVGWPRRLNGEPTDATAAAEALAAALRSRTGLPVFLQDERLTSHEADARLRERERDWRRRKARVDAAAAALVLQDHLDGRAAASPGPPSSVADLAGR